MQKFNYHSHTYRCRHADLDLTDEEYVIDYIKMGFKTMAFTDHCPEKNEIDTRKHMRMKYSERHEYLDSIKKLKEKYKNKIEIQSGYEVEYLPGEEENLKELKAEADKIILGQHFIYDENKELAIVGRRDFSDQEVMRYAEYIEKAMENNIPNIIAHPDFYMLRRGKFREIERMVAEKICQAAEKYNIPLEINLNNIFQETYWENKILNNSPIEEQRKKLSKVSYPCKGFWEVASKYDIKVLYGIDAHHRGHILLWKELIELAHEVIGKETMDKLKFIEDL